VRCAAKVADALIYLHSRKPEPVIHRDIKPANIIIDLEDRVWLVDFGLARAGTSGGAWVLRAGGKTVAAGTPGYTPLEQWKMLPSVRSDVYALGATMHHLLTAQDPRDRFASVSQLDLEVLRSHSRFDPLMKVRPGISPGLSGLVSRCLDANPGRRPAAQQLRSELERLIPTGSRLFTTVTRWSPAVGEVLGIAAATCVRMLFGQAQSAAGVESEAGGTGASKRNDSRRPAILCLYCRGQGVARDGRTCPICHGAGRW
jgi:serine/threonine protein kinase